MTAEQAWHDWRKTFRLPDTAAFRNAFIGGARHGLNALAIDRDASVEEAGLLLNDELLAMSRANYLSKTSEPGTAA